VNNLTLRVHKLKVTGEKDFDKETALAIFFPFVKIILISVVQSFLFYMMSLFAFLSTLRNEASLGRCSLLYLHCNSTGQLLHEYKALHSHATFSGNVKISN
jgi:hypothetical protein